jgi:uncharacterized membrane protein YedE/YeeE
MHHAFDPSLAFLTVGALPLSILLYLFYRGPEKARLGGSWNVPKNGIIDSKLLVGAAVFGIGWGISGVCRTFPHFPWFVNLLTHHTTQTQLVQVL